MQSGLKLFLATIVVSSVFFFLYCWIMNMIFNSVHIDSLLQIDTYHFVEHILFWSISRTLGVYVIISLLRILKRRFLSSIIMSGILTLSLTVFFGFEFQFVNNTHFVDLLFLFCTPLFIFSVTELELNGFIARKF